MFRLRQGGLFSHARISRRAGSLSQRQRRESRGASTCSAETLSRSPGLHRTGEAEGPAVSLLSTAVLGGGADGQALALPDLGRLRLADTVYLTREGPRTIGPLLACDRLARSCLLTLQLQPTDSDLASWATVAGVTCEGARSNDGQGASFLFRSCPWRETRWRHL